MQTGLQETDRVYADILVARGFLDAIQVEKAQARLVEARKQGGAASLIELLLDEGLLDPDHALAVRAEFDLRRQAVRAASDANDDGDEQDTDPNSSGGDSAASDGRSSAPSAEMTLTQLSNRPLYPHTQGTSAASEDAVPTEVSMRTVSPPAKQQGESGDTQKVSKGTTRRVATTRKTGDPLLGHVLGGCQLLEKIGEGGMGAVYRGLHLGLEKAVAVKVLPPATTANKTRVERFRREAKSAARIEHPNIVQILNVGEADGYHFIVMQFIDGIDLRHWLKRRGTLSPDELIETARQVAEGLKFAHDAGIVHRDIKPDNIMFDQDGRVKITDFGLAKALDDTDTTTTRPGRAVGTPYYMSPEQCAGKAVDERSDIYSLGATLYHVLTGQRPFKGETPVQTALMHLREPVKPPRTLRPDVPEVLDRFIVKMMSKDPAKRQQSCHELLGEIAAIEQQMEVAARLHEMRNSQSGSGAAAAKTLPMDGGGGASEAQEESTTASTASEATAGTLSKSAAAENGSRIGAGMEVGRRATATMMAGPSARPFVLLAALLAGGLFAGILIGLLSATDESGGWSLQGNTTTNGADNNGNDGAGTDGTGTSRNGTGSNGISEEEQRNEDAKVQWVAIEFLLEDELDQGNYLHAMREVRGFVDAFGDTPSGGRAREALVAVRDQARRTYRERLDDVRGRIEPLRRRHQFAEAIELVRSHDPTPELDELGLGELSNEYWRILGDLRQEAERTVDAALAEARRLVEQDPPEWFAALERLETATVVGIEQLLESIAETKREIEHALRNQQTSMQQERLAYLQSAAQEAQRLAERTAAWETELNTLAGVAAVRDELKRNWTPESPVSPHAATVQLLDAELGQLEALHREIASRMPRRASVEVYLHDNEDMFIIRIDEVDEEQSRFVAEVSRPVRHAAYARTFSFDEISLRTIRDWVPARFIGENPSAIPMFALARGQRPSEHAALAARHGHGPLVPYRMLGRAWELLYETETLLIDEARGEQVGERATQLRDEAYEAIEQIDPHNGPVKLARTLLLARHYGEVRLAAEQLDKIPAPYFEHPLFTLTQAEIALMREEASEAEEAALRWIVAMLPTYDEMSPEEMSEVQRYFQSRALFYRSQARTMRRRQEGEPPTISRELNELSRARSLDPGARDIYDAFRALQGMQD